MRIPADRKKFGFVLEKISIAERNKGNPLLSVIVVRTDTKRPGIGFHKMARSLGAQRTTDNKTFFERELAKARRCWHGR